jgi:hypothetical protein
MKKSELIELIREIVVRKLNEADIGASVSVDQKGNVESKIEAPQKEDDVVKIPPADQSKLNNLKTQQDKINNSIRKIDGTIKKLEAPVLKKKQDLTRKKASLEQSAGKTSTEIEKIQKKYNK